MRIDIFDRSAEQGRILRGELSFTQARTLLSKGEPEKRAGTRDIFIGSLTTEMEKELRDDRARNVTVVTMTATFDDGVVTRDLDIWKALRGTGSCKEGDPLSSARQSIYSRPQAPSEIVSKI